MKESYDKDGKLTPKAAAVVSALISDSPIVSDATEELLDSYLKSNVSSRNVKQTIEAQTWLSVILNKGDMGFDAAQASKVCGIINCVGDIIIKMQNLVPLQK